MPNRGRGGMLWVACRASRWCLLGLLVLWPLEAAIGQGRRQALPESEREAIRLLRRGEELLELRERERGVRVLESVAEQYPTSRARFDAYLALGRHYLDTRDQSKAIHYLGLIRALETEEGMLTGADRDTYLEALYLLGVAQFQVGQYGAAFPVLRRITTLYPNTLWANQAYYYIGMSHFAQQNWSKAIENLSLVGTFVDAESPTVDLVEAGRRFYVRVRDADLPVMASLGQEVSVEVETSSGDRERILCIPLATGGDVFIGSIQTEVGPAQPGDDILQVVGGDMITTRYVDANTREGETNVVREAQTRVVSTATVQFTLGDHETVTQAAFLDQPLFIALQDVDLDVSPAADSATVELIVRYKDEDADADATLDGEGDFERFLRAGEVQWRTRSETRVTLLEQGENEPIHTGQFQGSAIVATFDPDQPLDVATEGVLYALPGDEIVARYEDERHIAGEEARMVEATAVVVGVIDNRPRASQDVVFDPVLRARKYHVEATAYLELARIFRSLGLVQGARERAHQGLIRVDALISSRDPIPSDLQQESFRLKWELHIAADELSRAIETCRLFNRLYPDSPFADQALMGIAKIRLEQGAYGEAITLYRQVLGLQRSESRPEAQFRIAEAMERVHGVNAQQALTEYRRVAEHFPESHFAGESLSKLVDYHIETRDLVQAEVLLRQVFEDYPDAAFLDSMLLKWVLVSFRAGNFQQAYDLCARLMFEYPESPFAERAKQIMPRIESRIGSRSGEATGASQ